MNGCKVVFKELPFMVMICMCPYTPHTPPFPFPLTPTPHTHPSYTPFFPPHTYLSYTPLPLTHPFTHSLLTRTYTHVPPTSTLLPTHTAWSLQRKNLIPQTNLSLPRNQATIEPTALKAAKSIHPQPYPSWELPCTQESECSMKNVEHSTLFDFSGRTCKSDIVDGKCYVCN